MKWTSQPEVLKGWSRDVMMGMWCMIEHEQVQKLEELDFKVLIIPVTSSLRRYTTV